MRKRISNFYFQFCFTSLLLGLGFSAFADYSVSFRSAHNKYFVNEGNGGNGQTVNANRSGIGPWEKMILNHQGDGCIKQGSRVSIQSGNRYYWSAQSNGRLDVNRTQAGSWERFTVINHSNSTNCIANNDLLSLRSAHNKYVVAESNGQANANRSGIGSWEKFRVLIHSEPTFSIPDSGAEVRKVDLRQSLLAQNPNPSNYNDYLAMKAKEGIDISATDLDKIVTNIFETSTGDFRLSQLVRTLFLSGDKYEDQLLQHLINVRYWFSKGEDLYVYWSENHILMWTAAAYLLKEKYGWEMDQHLETRLNHALDLKLKYGFYEFFSTTYYPYTLGALLNLYDFAEDPIIRDKAEKVANRLMSEMLMAFNDQGALYPAAGRNYPGRYTDYRAHSMFWVVTGKGPKRTDAEYMTGFITTTGMNFDKAAASYKSVLNTTLRRGHEQSQKLSVHAGLTREERTVFQWSSGGYFHPDTATDTGHTVDYYDLEGRSEFKDLASVAFLPNSWLGSLSKIGATFSRGSNLSKSTIDVYKNKNVVLTSLDNYYPGYKGYQQWPWAATLEDIAIWTQSGEIKAGWNKSGSSLSQNSHLPRVIQDQNVALITYFPNFEIRQGNGRKGVTLHWPTERFDEHGELPGHRNGNWVVARKNDSYIAVLRYRTGTNEDGYPFNWGDKGRQMWAVVVGNKDTHGSYQNFKNKMDAGSIKETFNYNFGKMRKVYHTEINVDGKKIVSRW